MKLLVFSDVHGNLPALEAMLNDAPDVDGYICLGDTVDYGPWSNECVDLVTSLKNIVFIEGNHEADFIKGTHTGDNLVANTFFDFCRPFFKRYDKITNLKREYTLNNYVFRHTILNKNIYPDSEIVLDNNYVIGHSHHQFMLHQGSYTLINSGSVGQNRKYINVINYLLLESDEMKFEMRAIRYNADTVIEEMRKRGYPDLCINYYNTKERFTGGL